ncbi:MAG: response regulator [Candidatus Magasanikbacteria bacterium]|jgi:DNA-binding NtrC family response regulator|nr:response regulator [Candidatus Magasanikbacteria bacterium]
MSTQSHSGPKVLVVEDEIPLQKAITQKLERSGLTAVGVRSVAEAETALSEDTTIQAIWLDHYLLGQESGLDLVVKLKGSGAQYQAIPIFVVSNTASDDKVQQYLKLGVVEYYVKATNKLEQIIDDVKQTLGIQQV